MKKRKRFRLAAVLAGSLLFVGCKPNAERDMRFYENAAAYQAGEFIEGAAAVKQVVIDWIDGEVELEQSPSGKTTVFEEENGLPEEKRLHTYLNDGVLHVKYCRSGCLGKIDETQKKLQVDIPKGVDVEINSVRANVYLGVLEAGELSVETDTGCIEAESIFCQKAEIETRSGYIGIGEIEGAEVVLESLSGDIHLGVSVGKDTEIETENGTVTLYLQGDVCALIGFETEKGALQTQRQYERQGEKYFFAASVHNAPQTKPLRLSVKTDSGDLRVQ